MPTEIICCPYCDVSFRPARDDVVSCPHCFIAFSIREWRSSVFADMLKPVSILPAAVVSDNLGAARPRRKGAATPERCPAGAGRPLFSSNFI